MTREQLITLAGAMATHVGRSEQTLSNHIVGHARLFQRLRANKSCTLETAHTAGTWFSDNWPADLDWPRDIPRPRKSNPKEAA